MKQHHAKIDLIDLIMLLFFLTLVAFVLFPLFWMLVTSFKSSREINQLPLTIFPKVWFFNNFQKITTDQYLPRYFLNSVIVAVAVTIIAVFGSAMMGFVFAKELSINNLLFYR